MALQTSLTQAWFFKSIDDNECPAVRHIGVEETVRRIIAKSILYIIGGDLQVAAGSSQLCAGRESGSEAALHTMHKIFMDKEAEAVLEVDAKNAFA